MPQYVVPIGRYDAIETEPGRPFRTGRRSEPRAGLALHLDTMFVGSAVEASTVLDVLPQSPDHSRPRSPQGDATPRVMSGAHFPLFRRA